MTLVWLVAGICIGAVVAMLLVRRTLPRTAPPIDDTERAVQRATADAVVGAERIQSALDVLPIGVIVVDSDARVVVRNRASDDSGGDTHSEVLVQAAVQHHLRAAVRGEER